MSASIPIKYTGALCVSATDVTAKKVPGQTKSWVDITGFIFPNGKVAPSGTRRGIYGHIEVPGRGTMAADYEQIPLLLGVFTPYGHVQQALQKQVGKTLVQMDQDAKDYRDFIDGYLTNPDPAPERATWLAMAQSGTYTGITETHIDADIARAQTAEAKLSMHTL